MTIKVFVYGTLRQNPKATHTLEGYKLLDLGPFPCIITWKDSVVHGNILTVDRDDLIELDRVEGVGKGLYTRERVKTTDGTRCWVYVADEVLEFDVKPVIIPSGDWMIHPDKASSTFSPYQEEY